LVLILVDHVTRQFTANHVNSHIVVLENSDHLPNPLEMFPR
jgi:hypothetical protein